MGKRGEEMKDEKKERRGKEDRREERKTNRSYRILSQLQGCQRNLRTMRI